jgi:hypothetical protein
MEANRYYSHFKELSRVFGVGINGLERCRLMDGNVLYKRRQQIDLLLPLSRSYAGDLLCHNEASKSVPGCCGCGEINVHQTGSECKLTDSLRESSNSRVTNPRKADNNRTGTPSGLFPTILLPLPGWEI